MNNKDIDLSIFTPLFKQCIQEFAYTQNIPYSTSAYTLQIVAQSSCKSNQYNKYIDKAVKTIIYDVNPETHQFYTLPELFDQSSLIQLIKPAQKLYLNLLGTEIARCYNFYIKFYKYKLAMSALFDKYSNKEFKKVPVVGWTSKYNILTLASVVKQETCISSFEEFVNIIMFICVIIGQNPSTNRQYTLEEILSYILEIFPEYNITIDKLNQAYKNHILIKYENNELYTSTDKLFSKCIKQVAVKYTID